MTGAQTVAGLGGIGLIAVNYWTGTQRGTLSSLTSGGSNTTAAHSTFVQIGGELLFVIVAVVIGGTSDGAGKAVLAAIIALWLLWAINHFGSSAKKTPSTTPAPVTGNVVNMPAGRKAA